MNVCVLTGLERLERQTHLQNVCFSFTLYNIQIMMFVLSVNKSGAYKRLLYVIEWQT